MKMKKYLLLFVIFCVCSLSFAQNSEVILSVGDDKITLDEFYVRKQLKNREKGSFTKIYQEDKTISFISFWEISLVA